ncbi:hypothetical protein ERO13_D09G025800v2, partial [Gossypium hirsutum]
KKCAACFREFNKMEHLVDHMRTSYHSLHEPTCVLCNKHCRSFDSLREHLIGPLPKQECNKLFKILGCKFCLSILESPHTLKLHQHRCRFSGVNYGTMSRPANKSTTVVDNGLSSHVVALACQMVDGGGNNESMDVCARVCMVDEYENIIFHVYVKPPISVPNYRYENSGIGGEHLRDGMPLKQVQRRIEEFLCNGEAMWKIRSPKAGKARILVGHHLHPLLQSLHLQYPSFMIRDTAAYPPLMKTNKLSNSLKYLTQTYLGYDIQAGVQDPYEDCVATMRLYLRMRNQVHQREDYPQASDPRNRNNFAPSRQSELERMSPEAMLAISRSDYYCWCLDSM